MARTKLPDLQALSVSPAAFRDIVLIDTDNGPARLGERLDQWQRHNLATMDPAWLRAAGVDVPCTHSRGWWEQCRGSGKTTMQAVQAAWLLAFGRRPVQVVVAAVDQDQANILKNYLRRLIELNPWLGQVLESQNTRVVNRRNGSTLTVLASNLASSWGLTPDAVCLDEVSMWPKPDLFHSLLSSAGKRRDSVLACILNAGHIGDWAWEIREKIKADPRWHFDAQTQPASWISKEHLAEQQRLLPSQVYARLWQGVWSDQSSDLIRGDDLERMFSLGDTPIMGPEPGWQAYAGCDIGIVRDFSALSVILRGPGSQYKVARVWMWRPTANQKVDLEQIERTIVEAHQTYRLRKVVVDPHQGEYLISRCSKAGVPIEGVPQTGAALTEQASLLIELISSGALRSYRHAQLERDIKRARIEERAYGLRLVHQRGADGHGDALSATAMALVQARRSPMKTFFLGISSGRDRDEGEPLSNFPHFASAIRQRLGA